jgi:MFS family permease
MTQDAAPVAGAGASPQRLRRNRGFRLFWSARTISSAGTGVTMVVLPVLVYRLTGSPAATAALTAVEAVPYLTFGLLAGVLADRLNQRKVMVTSDVAAALLLGSVPAAAALHRLTAAQLFVVALGIATAFVSFDAASFAALPALVGRAQLPAAFSLLGSSTAITLVIAPTVGASLIAVVSAPYVLGLDAASYAASAVLLASVRQIARRPSPGPAGPGGRRRIRADIAEGLGFLWRQPVVRTMTLAVFALCVTWGGTFGLLVVYATRALHLARADGRLGLLYSAGELGGLIAATVVPRLVKRPAIGRMVAAFMVVNCALLLLLAAAPGYAWALLLFSCYELTYVTVITAGITIRQLLTPSHLQGRVNTSGRLIAWGGQPAGALLGGLLAEVMPIRAVFGLMAAGVAAGAGLACWSCLRSGPLSRVTVDDASSP